MTNTKERDRFICEDYHKGSELHELARSYGLSERRIRQILDEHEVSIRKRTTRNSKPLSRVHERVGRRLYDCRFDRSLEASEAANELGWSLNKLRRVEQGVTEIELLDLLDIASYLGTDVTSLLDTKQQKV